MADREVPFSGQYDMLREGEIAFERKIMVAMGIPDTASDEAPNPAAEAWIERYGSRISALMRNDAELRGLMASDEARAIEYAIARLQEERAEHAA